MAPRDVADASSVSKRENSLRCAIQHGTVSFPCWGRPPTTVGESMTYRFGSGVPRSVTPERVRGILGFARAEEKEFGEILDAASFPAWMDTDPPRSGADGSNGDSSRSRKIWRIIQGRKQGRKEFYLRLRNLLSTAQGREEFDSAREKFEGNKRKRFRRADFFFRLIQDGIRDAEVKGIPGFRAPQHGDPDGARKIAAGLAAASAWEILAEQIWAQGILSGDSKNFLDMVERYPDLYPLLSDVRAGLVPVVDNVFVDDGDEKPEPARRAESGATVPNMESIEKFPALGGIEREVSAAERYTDTGPVANAEPVTRTAEPHEEEGAYERQIIGDSVPISDAAPLAESAPSGDAPAPDGQQRSGAHRHGAAFGHFPSPSQPPTTVQDGPGDREFSKDASVGRHDWPANDDQEDLDARLETVIAEAVVRRRFGLAHHLALAKPRLSPGANVVELVASNFAVDEDELVSSSLPALVNAVRSEIQSLTEVRPGHAALIAGAALVPGLSAPTGPPVAQLLSTLVAHLVGMPSLQSLVRVSAEVSSFGSDMSPEALRLRDSITHWRDEFDELRSETEQWLDSERNANTPFQQATQVWRRMLNDPPAGKRRESISYMLRLPSRRADKIDAGLVEQIDGMAYYWRTQGDGEIDRLDTTLRPENNKSIVGRARKIIRDKIREAVNLADRWAHLVRNRPEGRRPFDAEQARRLREAAHSHLTSALEEVIILDTSMQKCICALIERYGGMFGIGPNFAPPPSLRLANLLNGDLLADPEIMFGNDGRPIECPVPIPHLVALARNNYNDKSLETAAVERAKRWDFHGAVAAVDFGRASGIITDTDSIRTTIDEERVKAQLQIEEKIRHVSNRLDAAYAHGFLPRETFENLRQLIAFEPLDRDRSAQYHSDLCSIEEEIDEAHEQTRKNYQDNLDNLKKVSPEDRERIEDAIANDSFPLAEQYLDYVEKDGMIGNIEMAVDRPFDQFFPDFVDRYAESRKSRNVVETLKNLTGAVPPLPHQLAHNGPNLLACWMNVNKPLTRKNQKFMITRLDKLATAIGFEDVEIERNELSGEIEEYRFRCTPIADRRIIRLPNFGSRAAGNYRLFVVRGRDAEEVIFDLVDRPRGDRAAPNIVFFLGFLNADSRRRIAREFSSGHYRPTLVIDEALIAFVASQADGDLATLMDCALPFSFSEPYDPDSPTVPPEMFFGRHQEVADIVNTAGGNVAHFIFGGRRLGKSALLAHVAREHKHLKPDQLFLNIDLRGSGIGEAQGPDALWMLFAKILSDEGVCTDNNVLLRQLDDPECISKGIKEWLGIHPTNDSLDKKHGLREEWKQGRRILLLVDEADAFLEGDRIAGYSTLNSIMLLMNESGRRFKVVFSGLHNVQRSASDPNTQYAHLGDAICVGPILPDSDGKEAQNLVREPIEALGYRFDSPDLVVRIAAETSYYPTLIQQFCKELLRHLRKDVGVSSEKGPPWVISSEIIDRVSASRETRDRIRSMFRWTVQLDPRYEFLTYLIARSSFGNGAMSPRAVSIHDIRRSALQEWKIGFPEEPDQTYWMFEVLLDEMQGLGILRKVTDKGVPGYAIRTRNLRMLIGNNDEIERRFRDAKGKRPPARFHAAQFRNDLDATTPSSLTGGQRRRLLECDKAVGLIFGTRLGGLDRVCDSLSREARDKPQGMEVCLVEATPYKMQATLGHLAASEKEGMDVVLVDMRGAWDAAAVDYALTFVDRGNVGSMIIRPVFLCGPAEAWEWSHGKTRPNAPRKAVLRDIWLGPCKSDFARMWLERRDSEARSALDNVDCPADSPWPIVLAAAAERPPETMSDAINAVVSNNENFSDIVCNDPIKEIFRGMREYHDIPMSTADLVDVVKGEIDVEYIHDFLKWATLLGLVLMDESGEDDESGGDRYRLHETCAAGLEMVLET